MASVAFANGYFSFQQLEPWRARTLGEFWGRRWDRVVQRALHILVYSRVYKRHGKTKVSVSESKETHRQRDSQAERLTGRETHQQPITGSPIESVVII